MTRRSWFIRRFHGIAKGLVGAMAFGFSLNTLISEGNAADLRPNEEGIVFAIGKLDGNRVEFQREGWDGVSEFECTAGVDCSADRFPMRIHAPSAGHWDHLAVQRVKINFQLAEALDSAQLTLSRAGDETSVLAMDGEELGVFTNEMIGCKEGTVYGALELPLGPLAAGRHVLTLSVEDDGEGNQRHSLDAIILRGSLASGG